MDEDYKLMMYLLYKAWCRENDRDYLDDANKREWLDTVFRIEPLPTGGEGDG